MGILMDYKLSAALAEEIITTFNEFTLKLETLQSNKASRWQEEAATEILKKVETILALKIQLAERDISLD